MNIEELDTVVIKADLPNHGLKNGDVGKVVQVYSDEAVEVEFVTASGRITPKGQYSEEWPSGLQYQGQ